MSTVATPTPLLDFYTRLAEDEELLEEFERDPQAALERAGFSGDELAALLEGDLDTIRATIRDEIREMPRSEQRMSGEHKEDGDESGEHTGDDDDSGEHTGDDGEESGEHHGGGGHQGGGEHHPDDDDDSGEHTGDE
jgi:hypothetical protein